MAAVQKISENLLAIGEADYAILRAAASDGAKYWDKAQTYKRELIGARAQLAASRKTTNTLLVLLGIVAAVAIVWAVYR